MNTKKIRDAIKTLSGGKLVAFPTDTVYGIGCDPFNEGAIEKLYEVKGRSKTKSIPVLVSSIEKAEELGEITPTCKKLLEKHWPGALTVVVKQKADFPSNISQDKTVALRMPDNPLALQLIEAVGGALATTSANITDEKPATTYEEAQKIFPDIFVIDGGITPGGIASTVVDCQSDTMQVLRDGPIKL